MHVPDVPFHHRLTKNVFCQFHGECQKMHGQRRGQITISEAVAEMLEHTVCKPCSQCEVGCVMDSKGGERVRVVTQS